MAKRITAIGLVAMATVAVMLAGGCGPDTDLTGTPIPNSLPNTRVTARPPELIETGFVVEFYWTAVDPDGRIAGYQWKMSDNGTDGISVQDTLTFDPATGDTLNPWNTSLSTDSTFVVTADIPDFPGDVEGVDRSYQTHTFFVRAIDEDGGVDPTPAFVSFTSTTLLPTVRLTGPTSIPGQVEAARMPSTVTFLFEGADPDFETGLPTEVRYLWKRAVLPNGEYADTRIEFENNIDDLVAFEDSAWSPWIRYETDDELRRISLPDQPQYDSQDRRIMYLFAMQARDTAGAVSIDRSYSQQVGNVSITQGLAPSLQVFETFLGAFTGSGPNVEARRDIAAGQELNFAWTADASGYAGVVESYRYGWDLADVNDPNDPNWALPPGNSTQHRRAENFSFDSGVHTLTIEVRDNSQQLTRMNITLSVVPVPDPANQLPMLLVDDVNDRNSSSWTGENGDPLDRDDFRDLFWRETLGGPGGVAGWDSLAHTIDSEDQTITYRDAVRYRAITWAGRWAASPNTAIASLFRPAEGNQNVNDVDKYVWMVPYQETVGNLFYASSRAMINYLAESAYELPIVFESREGNRRTGYESVGNDIPVRRGFGYRELPSGEEVQVGLSRYPFATVGVSVVDVMSPSASYYEYGNGRLVNRRRKGTCVGLKGLAIDADFRADYMPGGGVFADTIWTDETVDWNDPLFPDDRDVLQKSYIWGEDEFYNADIVSRNTPWTLQMCEVDGVEVECIEPMFRSVSRFDWVRTERQRIDPEDTWPDGYYGGQGQLLLSTQCGDRGLNTTQDRAVTNDQYVAFITNKTAINKPSQKGDVVFGFDPYRFDNTEMKKVIRWVLGEHFGLDMTAGGK
ncbi:hypothetical protein GF314_16725 [bacterium]|nr:hypothetical protein [bacterium]